MTTTSNTVGKRKQKADKAFELDDFDDFEGDDGLPGDEFDMTRPASLTTERRLEARRAIELAREERALRRELEDYLDY